MAAEESWPQCEDAWEQRDGCDMLASESLPVHGILVKHAEEWRNTEAWTLTVPTRLCTSFGFLLYDTYHRGRLSGEKQKLEPACRLKLSNGFPESVE